MTTVSLENVLLDVKELGRGMELIRRECSIHDNSVLRNFLSTNEGKLDKLQRDAKTAEVSAGWRRAGQPGPRHWAPLAGRSSGSWIKKLLSSDWLAGFMWGEEGIGRCRQLLLETPTLGSCGSPGCFQAAGLGTAFFGPPVPGGELAAHSPAG